MKYFSLIFSKLKSVHHYSLWIYLKCYFGKGLSVACLPPSMMNSRSYGDLTPWMNVSLNWVSLKTVFPLFLLGGSAPRRVWLFSLGSSNDLSLFLRLWPARSNCFGGGMTRKSLFLSAWVSLTSTPFVPSASTWTDSSPNFLNIYFHRKKGVYTQKKRSDVYFLRGWSLVDP